VKRFLPLLIICCSVAAPVAAAKPLGPGDRGRAVKTVQRALGIAADGIYGRGTARAVRHFQRRHDLLVTGRVDGPTREALFAPAPQSPTHGGAEASDDPVDIVSAARSALGSPYEAGAAGPRTFDCSGLVVWAGRAAGIELPRSSFAQFKAGRAASRAQIAAGTLVFFDTNGPGPSDVGIAISPTEAVSATTHGVREHEIFGPYWGEHYVGARRLD
jgi:cell wall-associated NlpC family hydrolase